MCLWKSLKQIFWFKDKVVLEWHQYCKRLTRTVLVLSLIIPSLTQTTKLQKQTLFFRLPARSLLSLLTPHLLLLSASRSLSPAPPMHAFLPHPTPLPLPLPLRLSLFHRSSPSGVFFLAKQRSKEVLNISGCCEIETLYVWILPKYEEEERISEDHADCILAGSGLPELSQSTGGGEKLSEAALLEASRVTITAAIASDGVNTWGRSLPSGLGGQPARSSVIPSPDYKIVYPLDGEKLRAKKGGQVPRVRRLPLRSVQLVRAHTRSGTANFLHHFAFFKMILTYFLYRPPTGSHNYNSSFPLSAGISLSGPSNLLWGYILHFSLPLIPPQTYMSKNRELRHDTLMFLSGDALCSHREGGRPGGEGSREREGRNHSTAPVEIHIRCMFLSHLK